MLRSNIQMGEFIAQLKKLLYSVVVKRNKLAAAFDSDLEQKKAADRYINTIDNGDDWNSYVTFDREVLLSAGVDESLIRIYQSDKEKIPREMRAKIVSLQKQFIIDNYVEMNDYYLMLHGEPPVEDTSDDWIYCPENDFGVPTTIPVHKLDNMYVNLMSSTGLLDTLIAKYPTKTYLKYLGPKSIDYYRARTADNFAVLYVDIAGIDSTIREDFLTMYDKARAYYMIGFYNREYSNMFAWYDEFIGLCIITMATQRLIANIYRQGLTRDFYDTNLIKYLFKSYSIPYIEELDLRYQRALAKNLNYLLQYKSTDKVLYDISYLLGFYDINIYKYYLIKYHKLDADGKPIFVTKTEKINGETVETYDYPKMFGFYFQQINLHEDDVNAALADQRFKYSFDDITGDDPYWVTDYELMQKLYKSNFNHLISKYMSLDVTVKVVELLYEVAHTIRMIVDDKKDFSKISVNIPAISQYDISLFDIIMLLSALAANQLNLPGTIPLKGYQIANVYGFNYSENIDALKAAIYDTKDLNYGEILYAEDTGIFYKVHPGDVVKLPNPVRNESTGSSTDATTTLEKYRFEPLNVVNVASFDDLDPVVGTYYRSSSDDTHSTIFMYGNNGYIEYDVTVVYTLTYNLIDNGLATYIESMRAVKPEDVGVIYSKLKTLRLFITKMLTDVKDKDAYYQYRKLYRALLVTEDVKELYNLGKGDISTTFAKYLEINSPTIYEIYLRLKDDVNDSNNAINAIFSKLASFGDYKYLANIGRIDRLFDVVMKLIRFFKSYTVDFVNSGINYVLDDRYLQGLKLIDDVIISGTGLNLDDQMARNHMWYKDFIEGRNSVLRLYDYLKYYDKMTWNVVLRIWDEYQQKIHDDMKLGHIGFHYNERFDIYDDIIMEPQNEFLHSKYKFSDYMWMTSRIVPPELYDHLKLHDGCKKIIARYKLADDTENVYSLDNMTQHVDFGNPMKSYLALHDKVTIIVNRY